MIKKLIPNFAKRILKNTFGLARMEAQLADLQHQLQEIKSVALPPLNGHWHHQDANRYEPPVNLVLRDLCEPGAVIFDCGANIGHLTILMSRLAGPRGVVCAFEASPRTIEICQRNLVTNGCHNVTLYHAAIGAHSGTLVPLQYGEHDQADRVLSQADGKSGKFTCLVPSLSLDDYVHWSGLAPSVIKLDIEGAEYDALRGFEKTIARTRPHLILEAFTDDARSLNYVREKGYRVLDLTTYREVATAADYPVGATVRNLLCIHNERVAGSPYAPPISTRVVSRLTQEDFVRCEQFSLESKPISLPAGRYVIEIDGSPSSNDNVFEMGVQTPDEKLLAYFGTSAWLFGSYREWVIELPILSNITLFMRHCQGVPDTQLQLRGATIREVTPFSTTPARRVL